MANLALVRQVASQAARVLSGGAQVVGKVARSRAGRAVVGGVAGGAAMAGAERLLQNGNGYSYRRRRRGRGISATDIKGARRVMNFIKEFGYKPKMSVGGKRRKKRC